MLAICGRSGEIFLLTTSSKELISTLKMNARCRALAFTPDSNMLITHGGKFSLFIKYIVYKILFTFVYFLTQSFIYLFFEH